MSKTVKAGPISAERLKSFIERIEKLEEERKAIGYDVRDVYSEAKGVGYDVKTMRKIVALRRQDANDRAEAETLLDTYMHALGMSDAGSGTSVTTVAREPTEDELLAAAGRIAAEVEKCMDLMVDDKPPAIAAIQERLGCSTGKAFKIRTMVAAEFSRRRSIEREMKKPGEEAPPAAAVTSTSVGPAGQAGAAAILSCGGVVCTRIQSDEPEAEPDISSNGNTNAYGGDSPASRPLESAPQDLSWDSIASDHPAFLRRAGV